MGKNISRKTNKSSNKAKGKLGEELACEYVKKLGHKILETNWRYSRFGEIDIISLDKKTLSFIEVKARTSEAFGHPLEAIDQRKMNQIRSIAQAYLNEPSAQALDVDNYRFDAVSVILSKPPKIDYHKNFYMF